MSKTGSKLLLAAAFGLVTGIGVGILLAPAKGSKTRKRLKKRILGLADTLQGDLSEKMNEFKAAFASDHKEDHPDEEFIPDEKEGK
jgi:gas vesicle protein